MSVPAIPVGKAAKAFGISAFALRHFCETGVVPYSKGPRGHMYVDTDRIPDWGRLGAELQRQFRIEVDAYLAAITAMEVELESLRLDAREALETGSCRLISDVFGSDNGYRRCESRLTNAALKLLVSRALLDELTPLQTACQTMIGRSGSATVSG